jgi:putative ABC transport system permease protein
VRSLELAQGRFFNQQELHDRAMVCVLGSNIAERLFGGPDAAVGREVYFFRARLRVVGVCLPKGADIVGTDQDEQVFVPLSTYMRRMANTDAITGVYVELAPGADPEQARSSATGILRQRHGLQPGQPDDFFVLTARDTNELQQQALDLVSVLGLISSSVSFAVGGLGILSIMILLVRARRLEIGVRRAVGARRGDIVAQFLFESGLLSGVGGALGVVVALVLLGALYALSPFPAVFDPLLIAAVPLGSVALGLAAGPTPLAGLALRNPGHHPQPRLATRPCSTAGRQRRADGEESLTSAPPGATSTECRTKRLSEMNVRCPGGPCPNTPPHMRETARTPPWWRP